MDEGMKGLKEKLLALPEQERVYLAGILLMSLDQPDDENYDRLWMEEINRRLAEIREGKVELVSVEEVIRDIRARLAQ